jgi:hypothetical protein
MVRLLGVSVEERSKPEADRGRIAGAFQERRNLINVTYSLESIMNLRRATHL